MEKLKRIIAETFGISETEIKDDMEMKQIESWDSLTHMELIANLESEYDIEFTADEIMEMTTILKVKNLVEAKINGN